jgi:inorganic pyrophosphatase
MAPMISTDFLGKIVLVKIDRPLGTRHGDQGLLYLLNYGYIPGCQSPDGEDLDAYILGVYEPVTEFKGRCIAVIRRLDDQDDKLIIVPDEKQYTDEQILALTEFQERFFHIVVVRENPDAGN